MSIKFGFSAGNISHAWGALYSAASKAPLPDRIAFGPAGAEPYIDRVWRGAPYFISHPIDCDASVQDGDRVLVLFSGGKDSLATALKLQAQGFRPVLLHVQGINPAYPGERAAAARLAAFSGFSLLVAKVAVTKGAYLENPTKNQMLLAIAADIGIRRGINRFAAGILTDDKAADVAFESGFSDAVELHEAAADWLETAVTGTKVHRRVVQNDTDSLLTVAAFPHLLDSVGSCMATQRFRTSLHNRNSEKFKVALMPGRCGSCYKCALEYLHLNLIGRMPANEKFTKHCCAVLQKATPLIYGEKRSLRDTLKSFIDGSRVDYRRLL